MSLNKRSDLFLNWNPSSSGEADPATSDVTVSWEVVPAAPVRPELASGANAMAHFTLHPDPDPPPANPAGLLGATLDAPVAGTLEPEGGSGHASEVAFPLCGEGIGGFRLVSELGRGAFGRVYLAEEAGLGNRPVALKVTRAEGDEPRILARLQHTHIVPIYSVRDDPETGLRLMCMPYFGGANLAQVLDAATVASPRAGTGLSLIEALDVVGGPAPSETGRPASIPRVRPGLPARPAPGADSAAAAGSSRWSTPRPLMSALVRIPLWSRSLLKPRSKAGLGPVDDRDPVQPARRFYRESGFVRSAAWIAARLTEGLEHAHSRGLLHRDLKPSNILIAADGTPMLLDFNLATDADHLGEGDRVLMGGTLPYMAPEHLDAFHPSGTTPPEAVDERSDIYAMGLILFEMIAGHHPFPEPPSGRPLIEVVRAMALERLGSPPSPRASNPDVPLSLDAIVRKALDPDPGRRHARAGDLAEDLRRFLDDRPLKYTSEPSLRERLAKWSRRNPRATGASTVGALALLVILMVGLSAWTLSEHLGAASARLRLRAFEAQFDECQFLLNTASGPVEHLGRGIRLAEDAIAGAGVPIDGGAGGRPGAGRWVESLVPEDRVAMRGNLSELILLVATARVVQAERSRSEEKRRKALEGSIARLDLAERLDPHPPRILFENRSRYYSALGEAAMAAADRKRRDATPVATGRDFYLQGTALLAQGHPDQAEPPLLKSVGLEPRRFWAWFALGLCHYDQGRFAEAAGDFAVCTVLTPRFAWPWLNRGLALARSGRLVEARESYNRAIEADGRLPEALANRGLAALELGDAPAAVADLARAIALGLRDLPIRAAYAEALARSGRRAEAMKALDRMIAESPEAPLPRVARGTLLTSTDPAAAEADFRQILAASPSDPAAHLGLARLRRQSDPRAALAEADLALNADPNRPDGLELRAWLRARLGDPRALDDLDRLLHAPTAHRLYNAACALALLHEARPDLGLAPRAVALIRRALESGFPPDSIPADPDLKSLADLPAFRALLGPALTSPHAIRPSKP